MAKKVGFKSSYADFRRIMGDLSGRNYKSCYLLMGEEDYFIDRIADKIATKVVSEDERDFSQHMFYGRESDCSSVMAALRSYPMLSDKNVVIIKEAQALKELDKLQHYFKSPLDTTLFVICYKGGNLDKRSALYKKIAENGEVLESAKARDYEIGEWIVELIRNKGCGIDPIALAMLVDYLGTSLSKIDNEITKLLTRIDPSVKNITPKHIEDNIGISKDFNNFELTKALSEAKWHRALVIVSHFAQNPKDNPVVVTISSLFTHFQRIFTLGIIGWNTRRKKTSMPSDNELCAELNLSMAFFLKEYKDAVSIYPPSRAYQILALIREYDGKIKGLNGGNTPQGELLVELIEKIKFSK